MTHEALFPMPQTARTSDDYWTPKWLFDALGLEFDLDVACPPEGPPHTPALAWYTQETDGLASPWWGRVWMNPPFSNTSVWVDKWIKHGNGIALLPVVKHSRWVSDLWESPAQCCWINQREIKFHRGDKMSLVWPPIWLWAIGDECINALSKIGHLR